MNRDTVLYMLKNFVDIRSIITVWMPTCRRLRSMILDPSVLIDYKLEQYRARYPVIDLYMKRGKTQALIYAQPLKFLLGCEDLDKNTINAACTMLRRIFPEYIEGSLANVEQILDVAENQKFAATDLSYDYGLLIPPQYAHFYSLCQSSNRHQEGLTFIRPNFQPYCWSFKACEGIMRFAEWTDCGSDGSSYLHLVCDVHSPWYGRFVYYTYRRDGKFHVLQGHPSFTDFLQILVDNENLTKKHQMEWLTSGANLVIGNDEAGNTQKPIGHFTYEVHYY